MTSELVLDLAGGNVPDTDDLVLGTSGKVLAVGTEAHASDVKIAVLRKTAILEMRDRVSVLHIEDLRGAVAARRNVATVQTEAHTADDTLMGQVVDEVDVKHTPGPGVEDGIPVVALALVLSRQLLDVEIGQTVSLGERQRRLVLGRQCGLLVVGWRGGPGNLWRARVRGRVVLLGGRWATRRAARRTGTLAAGRGCGLRGLPVSCGLSALVTRGKAHGFQRATRLVATLQAREKERGAHRLPQGQAGTHQSAVAGPAQDSDLAGLAEHLPAGGACHGADCRPAEEGQGRGRPGWRCQPLCRRRGCWVHGRSGAAAAARGRGGESSGWGRRAARPRARAERCGLHTCATVRGQLSRWGWDGDGMGVAYLAFIWLCWLSSE